MLRAYRYSQRVGRWIGAALFVCAMLSPAAAQTPPTDFAGALAYLGALPPAERMAVLTREAAREGSVTLYSATGLDRAKLFIDRFTQQYPNVKVDFVRLTLNEVAQRLTLEARAGHVASDLMTTSPDWFDILNPYLAAYEPTTWAHYDPRFRHGGKDKGWTALDFEILPEAIAWRTDKVSSAEAPKTLDEVTDPKWRGRLGTVSNLERVIDSFNRLYGEAAAKKKIEALAANRNRLYPSIGALSAALGAGEVDIAWGIGAYRAYGLKQSGAPVDFVFEDPTLTIPNSMAVTKGAPHPYAAALFLEFMTSAATMEAMDKAEPARMFANLDGHYDQPLDKFPHLVVFQAIPEDRFKRYNRVVDQLFVRKQ